ncbi:unnamed protein product [Mytilus edulis]|uniref:C-type lectin domain-containing protein n=1 Tax=Mytilus edulis TaxID=6550 RepID=A0A8S3Q0V6_MYTED|nr:unnamed protein product [Mytilus edulis]
MKMWFVILSFLTYSCNGILAGTQSLAGAECKESNITGIKLEVNVMKENYHTLLQRVVENEQEITDLKGQRQQLENELENCRKSCSCEIENLRDDIIQNEHELNETIHSWTTFNETIQDLSQSVSNLNDKFLLLDPAEDTTECFSGWIKNDDYGACYFFSDKTMSWNDAQEQCRKQNGSLADILSANEAVWLADSIRNHDGSEFWIGGKRQDDVYQWVTSDGKIKDMNYTRWALGEPNGVGSYCVEIDKRFQYKWNDSACVWSQHFICKLYLT